MLIFGHGAKIVRKTFENRIRGVIGVTTKRVDINFSYMLSFIYWKAGFENA